MDRRGFLKSMLAAAAAPAIVKAENLMKLYVPPQEIVVPEPVGMTFDGCGDYMPVPDSAFGDGDWTMEAWMKPTTGEWNNVVIVRSDGVVTEYLNGNEVPTGTLKQRGFEIMPSGPGLMTAKINDSYVQLLPPDFNGHVNDIRITNGIARKKEQMLFAHGEPEETPRLFRFHI